MKIYVLNALVTNSKIPILIFTRPADIEEVKKVIDKNELVSYVGHPATVALFNKLFGTKITENRGMYSPVPGDRAVIIRLKKRLDKPEDIANITENDVEFIIADYMEVKGE